MKTGDVKEGRRLATCNGADGKRKWARVLGGRWSPLIVQALEARPKRFNQIKGDLRGVSSKTLVMNLKALAREGFIAKTVLEAKQLKVSYSLTDKGRELAKARKALETFEARWTR